MFYAFASKNSRAACLNAKCKLGATLPIFQMCNII